MAVRSYRVERDGQWRFGLEFASEAAFKAWRLERGIDLLKAAPEWRFAIEFDSDAERDAYLLGRPRDWFGHRRGASVDPPVPDDDLDPAGGAVGRPDRWSSAIAAAADVLGPQAFDVGVLLADRARLILKKMAVGGETLPDRKTVERWLKKNTDKIAGQNAERAMISIERTRGHNV